MDPQAWSKLNVLFVVASLVAACSAPPPGQRQAPAEAEHQSSAPKRIVGAIMVEPPALHRPLIPGAYIIQAGDLADTIVHVGLSAVDHQGIRRPIAAEAVPSVDNGQWRLLPSGQMEQVWRVRPGTEWHDGTPLTADDLVFTVHVGQ